MEHRIGVFVCHCGMNIAGTVDVQRVVEAVKDYPGVVFAQNYIYMCSDPGQDLVRKTIREQNLNGIVMSNCSPLMHEKTFRTVAAKEGLNPYLLEIANIREDVSWPHENEKELATQKAIVMVKMTIEKVRRNMALTPMVVPLHKRALVIGGGIAGITSALEIAAAGYEVVLVEKQPYIGGHAAQLAGTFPTLDRVPCLLAPKLAEAAANPRIKLYTNSELDEVSGYVGNFDVTVKTKPTYVDNEKCTACGLCVDKCPVTCPNEFDRGLSERKAIYKSPPEVSPQRYIIDADNCLYFQDAQCRACEEVCPSKAVDFAQEETTTEETVGAMVIATGYDLWDKANRTYRRRDTPALGRHGAQADRLHLLLWLPRPGARLHLLLPGLLHVHRQAGGALQPDCPRRAGVRLLHGHQVGLQGVRGVRQECPGRGARTLPQGQGIQGLPRRRQAQGLGK